MDGFSVAEVERKGIEWDRTSVANGVDINRCSGIINGVVWLEQNLAR